ncbi:hypothetical protein Q8W40_24330 [Vibrio penaeicida]|uniref:hypothetical protein n=1 Tax=Vibrio penaeicida TaxID=104609 RepID=UPI002735E96B|nr:hypothetical protein [Vibrio penaeicida]MDP2575346.1 hypothetical protein [Vibrio penaeicida]
MKTPCIMTLDLHRYLAEQDRLDEVHAALDIIREELTCELLSGKSVHLGGQKWGFDDVLSTAFETEEFCETCIALATNRDNPEGFLAQRQRYHFMIESAAETLASELAEPIYQSRKYGGFYDYR